MKYIAISSLILKPIVNKITLIKQELFTSTQLTKN